ncbi:DUF1016 N-terminal domain-containing protein [Escherichia coli]
MSGELTPLGIPQTPSAEFPSAKIWQTLSADLAPALVHLRPFTFPVKNADARSFYEKETLRCGWSVRQLERQIATQFYERTLLSHDKSAMLQQHAPTETHILPQQAIRDPFVLEFLELKDGSSESDLRRR